jgi:hypothetical protein
MTCAATPWARARAAAGLEALAATRDERYVGSLACERLRRREPDAARRAGDQDAPSDELCHSSPLPAAADPNATGAYAAWWES